MARRPFRILYRDFLFRVVDRELLSPHSDGDAHRILSQIAALLVFFSVAISIPASDAGADFSGSIRLFIGWRFMHFIVATTMLAVGVLAILSWSSMFPDHRDVLVLAPLPVGSRTILFAKVAAFASALAVAVFAMHVVAGLVWPLTLNRAAPALAMPSFSRDAAIPPVAVPELQAVLDRDLAAAQHSGWLAPDAGGGIAIGISRHGERRVLTYGAARRDSIFQIGSVTKTFTAFALASLVQKNQVRLDTPVRELLPASVAHPAAPQAEITLRDLATHRSGLPTMPPGSAQGQRAGPAGPFAGFGRDNLYAYLQRHGLERPADARFVYSNLGFALLGDVVAATAQTDYTTLVRQVTGPLGLNDTVVALSPEQRSRLLGSYDDEGQAMAPWELDEFTPAGGLYSTAPDLLAWVEAHLHPDGPLAPAFTLTRQPVAAARGNDQVGLAWMIDRTTASVRHSGAVSGYTADAFFSPHDDLALVVLANGGPGVVASAPRVAEHIRARLRGEPASSLSDTIVPASGGVRPWLRTMFAYWLTIVAASLFVAGALVGLQGLVLALLPRRHFLRISPALQLIALAALVGGYLLQPLGFNVDDLIAAESGGLFFAAPSRWFLGLYLALSGAPVLPRLATAATVGVGLALAVAALAYAVSYVRTLRGIVEEPDVALSALANRRVFPGHGPVPGLVRFVLHTLGRSAQPRVLVAFYWGAGLAMAVAFAKTPRGQNLGAAGDTGAWYETSVPLLVATLVMMAAAVAAARSAFAMPRDLASNWIFRMLPLADSRGYARARHLALLAVSVVPVVMLSAVVCFSAWPWQPALGHVIALALVGLAIVECVEAGTETIPFTCSYLPGRGQLHVMLVVIVLLILPLMVAAATFERDALQSGPLYLAMLAGLGAALALARTRRVWRTSPRREPTFDAEPRDRVVTLFHS